MLTKLRNLLVAAFSHVLPKRFVKWLFRKWHGRHFDLLDGKATDGTLHGLLVAMQWGLRLFPAWRERIQGWRGTLVFAAKAPFDGKRDLVQESAVFDGERMTVRSEAVPAFDVKVEFSDASALFSFLVSRNHDIVDALLANSVETTGNLNYVYRFGFIAIEMTRWLRLPA